ncbi:PSP1 domain-containing protein [Deinococcus radiophilus]|uniref:PSP1 C-terminal domain-containing protein n=1 Tax=Deinococcus radiophilus TaxID=32062 RepID=A0A431VTN1_9DEIO|nr:regulatory iron-sulfur-containing complex subunit RicT [Deinococcus radiophilus]RTR26511.1 hypothetical protein EJ104_08130 [Deinococcus radiophilus]UFA50576.1 hypothetical protein LMT64_01280 [Deinococcus radiophilus]
MQFVRYSRSPALCPVTSDQTYPSGTPVVVLSQRGPELAETRGEIPSDHPQAQQQPAGQLLREATPEDLAAAAHLAQLAEDLKWALRAHARSLGLKVKIVQLEFTLDESLVTLSYSAEERLDLRGLISEVRSFTPARVNFMAVGAREQAVVLGALGACGRENCSSRFLQELPPITIRMARDQQLPLNPDKLSGPCGRLMCCLQYEHDMYNELLRDLPRKGSRACHTGSGACGKVIKLHPLAAQVDLATESGLLAGVPVSELEIQRGKPGRSDAQSSGKRER